MLANVSRARPFSSFCSLPPGIFKNGIARKDENGTVLWQPTMQDGSYAEPYRFKPFGTTKVELEGILQDCATSLCPLAERIPERGHHDENETRRMFDQGKLEASDVRWKCGILWLILYILCDENVSWMTARKLTVWFLFGCIFDSLVMVILGAPTQSCSVHDMHLIHTKKCQIHHCQKSRRYGTVIFYVMYQCSMYIITDIQNKSHIIW